MEKRILLSGLLLSLLSWQVHAEGQQTPQPADKDAAVKVALVGYAANINSFTHYSCRYKITRAVAHSLDEALQGKFTNATEYECRLAVDGDMTVCEGLTPAHPPNPKNAIKNPKKPGVGIVPDDGINSDRYLADGQRTINFCPQMKSLGLWVNERSNRRIGDTPLEVLGAGLRNQHGIDVMARDTENYVLSSDGLEDLEGRPVVSLRLTYKKPNQVQRYSLDPGRGYLPTRRSLYDDNQVRSHTYLRSARECSGQRWFPEHVTEISIPNQPGGRFGVIEARVLEFDADHRPDRSAFAISVPAGTQVSDQVDYRNPFYLKQEEKIHVDDLASLFRKMDEAQTSPLMDTALPKSPWRAWPRWATGAAGVLIALVGGFLLLRRRLRRLRG